MGINSSLRSIGDNLNRYTSNRPGASPDQAESNKLHGILESLQKDMPFQVDSLQRAALKQKYLNLLLGDKAGSYLKLRQWIAYEFLNLDNESPFMDHPVALAEQVGVYNAFHLFCRRYQWLFQFSEGHPLGKKKFEGALESAKRGLEGFLKLYPECDVHILSFHPFDISEMLEIQKKQGLHASTYRWKQITALALGVLGVAAAIFYAVAFKENGPIIPQLPDDTNITKIDSGINDGVVSTVLMDDLAGRISVYEPQIKIDSILTERELSPDVVVLSPEVSDVVLDSSEIISKDVLISSLFGTSWFSSSDETPVDPSDVGDLPPENVDATPTIKPSAVVDESSVLLKETVPNAPASEKSVDKKELAEPAAVIGGEVATAEKPSAPVDISQPVGRPPMDLELQGADRARLKDLIAQGMEYSANRTWVKVVAVIAIFEIGLFAFRRKAIAGVKRCCKSKVSQPLPPKPPERARNTASANSSSSSSTGQQGAQPQTSATSSSLQSGSNAGPMTPLRNNGSSTEIAAQTTPSLAARVVSALASPIKAIASFGAPPPAPPMPGSTKRRRRDKALSSSGNNSKDNNGKQVTESKNAKASSSQDKASSSQDPVALGSPQLKAAKLRLTNNGFQTPARSSVQQITDRRSCIDGTPDGKSHAPDSPWSPT